MSVLLTVIVASLSLALLLEARFPLRAVAEAPLRRWFTNLSLSALSLATSLGATVGLYAAARALLGPHVASIELLPRIGAPAWVQWMLTFAVLDGTAYVLHRLSHSVPWLWRLHAVHHSDTEVDATTCYRHHPLESLFTAAVNVPLLMTLGLEHFRSAPQQQLGGLLAQPFVAPGERSQPPRKSAPTADVST